MYKKTLTYKDFDGNERTEDFYFNLTPAEVTEMELSLQDGLSDTLQRIIDTNDRPNLIKYFKEIILRAYGKRAPGGRFEKSEAINYEFTSSAAYSELFMLFATDADEAAAFINGIVPKESELGRSQKMNVVPANFNH